MKQGNRTAFILNYHLVHGHVYSRGIFFKKADHYDNFDCYTLGNAKPVVGTSENVAKPDYDVIKMATILNFNANLRCFIISIIVGRFQFFRHQTVQNDKCCLLIVCACAILKDRPVCYGTSRLKSRVCAVTRYALLKTPTLKSNKP